MPTANRQGVKPYTAIIISVSLFVVLDLSILALNFHIAQQIDEDSVAINLAGRQRMLTQQMAKQVLEQHSLDKGSARWLKLQQQFQQSFSLFDTTLHAFIEGGTVVDSGGRPARRQSRRRRRAAQRRSTG